MPGVLKSNGRTQPETLMKICRRFGEYVLKVISEGNLGIRQDSLKVQLITYYLTLKGEWSREREKADWQGHDLASLKYDTLRLITKLISAKGNWENHELFSLVAQISWAMENGLDNIALDVCDAAKQLAVEREAYGILIHVFELELRICEQDRQSEEYAARIESLILHRENITKILAEGANWEKFKAQVFDPILRKWELEAVIDVAQLELLGQHLSGIHELGELPLNIQILVLEMKVWHQTAIGNTANALNLSETLVSKYDAFPRLQRSISHGNFVAHLRLNCLLNSELGNFDNALKVLKRIEKLDADSLQPVRSTFILCLLDIGLNSQNETIINKALHELEDGAMTLLDGIPERDWVSIHWNWLRGLIRKCNWRKAYQICNQLLSRKNLMRKNIMMHVRLISFACEICLHHKDESMLTSSYWATWKFYTRINPEPTELIFILKSLFASLRKSWGMNEEASRRGRRRKINETNAPLSIGKIDYSGLLESVDTFLRSSPESK